MSRKRKLLFVPVAALIAAALIGVFGAPANAAVNYGRFTDTGSGKCLDMRAEDSFTVQQWACFGGDANQAWQASFFNNFNGTAYYQLINKKSGLCIGILNDDINPSAQAVTENCAFDVAQLWSFQNTVTSSGQLIATIHNLNTGYCLDVRGGSTSNGAIVQQYPCNGTGAQSWLESAFS